MTEELNYLTAGDLYRANIKNKYFELFQILFGINEELQKLKYQFKLRQREHRKICCAVLFVRALDVFQGVYILASAGLGKDAFAQTRNLFEVVLRLLYCAKGEKEFEHYQSFFYRDKRKWMKRAKEAGQLEYLKISENEAGVIIEECKENERRLNPNKKRGDIKDIAFNLNRHWDYVHLFKLQSDIVHMNPNQLEDYLEFDLEKEEVVGFKIGPEVNEESIDKVLATAASYMLLPIASEELQSLLSFNKTSSIEKLFFQLEKVVGQE